MNLAVTIIVSVNLMHVLTKMWLVVHCGIYNASESNFFVCVCVFVHCSWQHGIQFMAWTAPWQTGNWKITWEEWCYESSLSWWVLLTCAFPFFLYVFFLYHSVISNWPFIKRPVSLFENGPAVNSEQSKTDCCVYCWHVRFQPSALL